MSRNTGFAGVTVRLVPAQSDETGQRNPTMVAMVTVSSAKMPNSCWGRYVRVAVVDVEYWRLLKKDWRPAMISNRAKGVLRIVADLGHHHDGRTSRCASARAIARAQEIADAYNNAKTVAEQNEIVTWGGSA